MLEQISISAPARLHFGLFSIGDLVARKFGGIGLMIDSPRTIVTATRSDSFEIMGGPDSATIRAVLENWFAGLRRPIQEMLAIDQLTDLPVKFEVDSIAPRHSGFGSGTQLALSVAMAATRFLELQLPSLAELTSVIGRGKRSGIGSHGFVHGGFLVDRGKQPGEQLAPLDFQSDFPEQWSIVTVIQNEATGLSGVQELDAFANLPKTTEVQKEEMIDIVRTMIIPGVLQQEFEQFSDGLFEFGRRSGMMFSEIQGGPYNGHQIAKMIERIRDFGVKAVGQSSWGPCVFAITRNDETSRQLVRFLQSEYGELCTIRIARADNAGARTVVRDAFVRTEEET